MTAKQQNLVIAEACGATWQTVPPKENYDYRPKRILSFYKWEFDHPRCAPLPLSDPDGDASDTPDYVNDSDAMRHALLRLGGGDNWVVFIAGFLEAVGPLVRAAPGFKDGLMAWHAYTADPKHLAEAAVKALGKWINSDDDLDEPLGEACKLDNPDCDSCS